MTVDNLTMASSEAVAELRDRIFTLLLPRTPRDHGEARHTGCLPSVGQAAPATTGDIIEARD